LRPVTATFFHLGAFLGENAELPLYNRRFRLSSPNQRVAMSESNTTVAAAALPQGGQLDVIEIQRLLPHRYPFLLIDRVLEIERKKRLVAIKNVTANEPFFQGHFPGNPIMPGVLLVEAMAQAGAVLLLLELPDRKNKLVVFSGIERAKFRRPVVPGDQVRLEIDVIVWRGNAGRMQGKALVEGKVACETIISCRVIDLAGSQEGKRPAE
jgi:3-hydroxyacyl-[acyl-carrier-protein] dehydratase